MEPKPKLAGKAGSGLFVCSYSCATWENLFRRVKGRIQPTAEQYQAHFLRGLLMSIYKSLQAATSGIKINTLSYTEQGE